MGIRNVNFQREVMSSEGRENRTEAEEGTEVPAGVCNV